MLKALDVELVSVCMYFATFRTSRSSSVVEMGLSAGRCHAWTMSVRMLSVSHHRWP